jgi:hypothetical protein
VIMPANQPHVLKAVKKFKMILTMIKSWRKHATKFSLKQTIKEPIKFVEFG